MVIVWGSRLYGKVDEVPGLFHVATKFGHLYYLPLIPMGSHLVIEESSDGWRGAAIPMSWKSVLIAWARALLILHGLFFAAIAAGTATVSGAAAFGTGIASLLCFGLFVVSRRWSVIMRPSYERAVQYSQQVGLSPSGQVMFEIAYGNLSAEEGAKMIQDLNREPNPNALVSP